MLIHKKSRRMVLNLRDPDRVTTVVPTAKKAVVAGRTLVAVPHKTDETRVLRNLGIDAPGPMLSYYEWPGRFKPFEHQRDTADFLSLNTRAFCLNDMGTGKTLSILWAYDWLRSEGEAKSMLVVAPLSTLERTWADEVFMNFPHLSAAVLHGTAERRLKLLKGGYDVYIINHDGLRNASVVREIAGMVKSQEISVIALDELAIYRKSGTDRWKGAHAVVKTAKFVWGATGTPIPNEPTDVWAQIRLVNPSRVSPSFKYFRDGVMRQQGPFKWVPRENALETVYAAMQPAIRYSRSDCIDLPPTTYVTREAELTPEQDRAYRDMVAKCKAEVDEGQITALNEGVKAMKLLQIVCGVAYSADGNLDIPSGPRTELVKEIIESANAKVIVFVPLTGALNKLAAELSKVCTVRVVSGEVGRAERDEIFGEFQKARNPRVIVANPATMSHGLTLTAADTIVWYAPPRGSEIYQQANARIVRPGQKNNTLIVHIEGSELERRMYRRLQNRESMQGVLLGMFD